MDSVMKLMRDYYKEVCHLVIALFCGGCVIGVIGWIQSYSKLKDLEKRLDEIRRELR